MKQLLVLLLLCISILTHGQNASVGIALEEVSLLDLEPDNSAIVLSLNSPIEAGSFNKTEIVTNAKWLNYTSAVVVGNTRSIFAEIGSGTVPLGTQFSVEVSSASGGAGALGSSVNSVVLSAAPQLIISNIGGAYTGNGANNGHSLSYKLEVINFSQLDFNTTNTLGITYSIMDN